MGACMACFAVDICSCLACCACKACLSLLPQCTRLSLFSILFLTFLLAVILGKYFPERFNGHYAGLLGVKVASQCSSSDYINDCIYRQLVYRASLAMFLLFTLSSILAVSNFMNKSFMIIKFLIGVGAFIGFWWVDDTIFSNWAEVIRVFSFFWLVVQGLLLLDFAHDAHDLIIEETSTDNPDHNRGMYTLYSFTSLTALAAVVVGLVYLFRDYAGCSLGLFFTLLTLIVGVLCTIISLLNVVNRGMLTPLIMFAYSTFMCWYALTSSTDPGCNPSANSNNGSVETANIAVVCVVTLLVSLYVISQGSIVLNIFNPNVQFYMLICNNTNRLIF